jgi:hypothetical protein
MNNIIIFLAFFAFIIAIGAIFYFVQKKSKTITHIQSGRSELMTGGRPLHLIRNDIQVAQHDYNVFKRNYDACMNNVPINHFLCSIYRDQMAGSRGDIRRYMAEIERDHPAHIAGSSY